MRPCARLWPNLGAEEGEGWRRMADEPRVRSAVLLWRLLFGASAVVLDPADGERAAAAWPPALGAPPDSPVFSWLEQRGGRVPWWPDEEADAPCPLAVVRRVHDKAFALAFAEREGWQPRPLRGLARVLEPSSLAEPDAAVAELARTLAEWPAWALRSFTLKPRFGSSGRGRIAGRDGIADTPEIRGGLSRLAERGGALLEPWLERREDLSTQIRVEADGALTVLGSLVCVTSAGGAPLGHRGEVDSRGRVFSGSRWEEAAREAAVAAAAAAAAEGYRGVCGVDAFAFPRPDEELRDALRAVVEFNARTTLGLVAVGLVRRGLESVRGPLGLTPGARLAFGLALDAPASGWAEVEGQLGDAGRLLLLHAGGDSPAPALLFARDASALDAAFG